MSCFPPAPCSTTDMISSINAHGRGRSLTFESQVPAWETQIKTPFLNFVDKAIPSEFAPISQW